MENKQKKSNKDLYIIIAVAIAVLWGLPSLIEGKGFFNGIFDNIKALFWLVGIGIGILVIVKITEN
nr:hypothetical protein [uncultured Flavobacterium sp.]